MENGLVRTVLTIYRMYPCGPSVLSTDPTFHSYHIKVREGNDMEEGNATVERAKSEEKPKSEDLFLLLPGNPKTQIRRSLPPSRHDLEGFGLSVFPLVDVSFVFIIAFFFFSSIPHRTPQPAPSTTSATCLATAAIPTRSSPLTVLQSRPFQKPLPQRSLVPEIGYFGFFFMVFGDLKY